MDTIEDLPALLDLVASHTGPVGRYTPAPSGNMSDALLLVESEAGRFFVKGMSNSPGGRLDSLDRELTVNSHLDGIAPRLVATLRDATWAVGVFDYIDGAPADLKTPDGARCLARLIDRVSDLRLPVELDWPETRWDRFCETPELLRGRTICHGDPHGNNVIIERASGRAYLVDWAWPTLAAGFIDAALLANQLICAEHSPQEAEAIVSDIRGWRNADPKAVDAFLVANVRMVEERYARTEAPWIKAVLDGWREWLGYRMP